MAIFAIGDVQGCFDDLQRLLERVRFNAAEDRLWFTGDLVNRGPKSLDSLRFVRSMGERAITVLGNHDLHLLALGEGLREPRESDETLLPILDAPDCDELLNWLRHQPLMHHDPELGYALIHAGLAASWDIDTALTLAHEVETMLRGPEYPDLLANMYGNQPEQWSDSLAGHERARFIINCFTRMRYCDSDGRLDLEHKGPPGTQPDGLMPWFEVPGRASANQHILFGHWSTLGEVSGHNVYPLDTGCLWGGRLTALRLDDDGGWYSIDCPGAQVPGHE